MARKTNRRPESIKGIVDELIIKIEKKGPGKREKILNAWQKVAGEEASHRSRPIAIRKKVLTVEIDSSTWMYALNLEKGRILKELKKELRQYKVEGLRFRMGEVS